MQLKHSPSPQGNRGGEKSRDDYATIPNTRYDPGFEHPQCMCYANEENAVNLELNCVLARVLFTTAVLPHSDSTRQVEKRR